MKSALFVVEIENEVLDINGHLVLVSIERPLMLVSRFAVASADAREKSSLTNGTVNYWCCCW
jgi:hypothetical protein